MLLDRNVDVPDQVAEEAEKVDGVITGIEHNIIEMERKIKLL